MPTRTFISVEENLALTQWYGVMTLDEMMSSQRHYMACDRYQVGRPHLFDVSGVTSPEMPTDGFHRFIDLVKTQDLIKARTQVTVFAPHEILFGLARQYQSLSELIDSVVVTIFKNERDALANVGKDDDCIDDLAFRYRDDKI